MGGEKAAEEEEWLLPLTVVFTAVELKSLEGILYKLSQTLTTESAHMAFGNKRS